MVYRLCREKTKGTVYYLYKNGSYSKTLEEYGSKDIISSWDVWIGLDFWICRIGDEGDNNTGTRVNPLYASIEGVDTTGFMLFGKRVNFK